MQSDDDVVAERAAALAGLEDWLRTPMLVLSAAWLVLVLVELAWGGGPPLDLASTTIWVAFLLEFALRLALAPARLAFLRRNWLTVIALLAPALRLLSAFRVLRLAGAARGLRVVRGLRLVRVIGTANRGMNTPRAAMRRRGAGYVLALTALVTFLGAACMYTFEPATEVEGGFASFGDALWWTAMLITTMGSELWPRTPEGRVLCLLLAVYAFTVFGYITASFTSVFVGRDAAATAAAASAGRPLSEAERR